MRSRLVPLLLLWAVTAGAADPLEAHRAASEERARAEAQDLLRTLCPEQCVLLSVSAQVELEAPPDALPVLTAREERRPALRSLRAHVAVDAALPKDFPARLQELVALRLRGLGAPARVSVETLAFPARRGQTPDALPAAATAATPSPQIITLQLPPPPEAPPRPEPAADPVSPPGARAISALADAAPGVLLGVIACVTLLLTAALLALSLRRREKSGPMGDGAGRAQGARDVPGAGPSFEGERLARRLSVREALSRYPAAAGQVVREALERGEVKRVAVWLRELGAPLVEVVGPGTARDPLLVEALSGPPPEPAHAADALAMLEGRITAAHLGGASEGHGASFDFLRRYAAADVVAALSELSPEDRALVLRLAPDTVREAVLPLLTLDMRRELAVRWAVHRGGSRVQIAQAAAAMRASLERAWGATDVGSALADLLGTFPPGEQQTLLAELSQTQPELAARLVVESTLPDLPPELLRQAVLRVEPGQLATFIAGADEVVRSCVLAAAPGSLQRDLREELSHRAAPPPPELRAARRALLRAVEDELRGDPPQTLRPKEAS